MLIRFVLAAMVIFTGVGSALGGILYQSRRNPAYSCLSFGNITVQLDRSLHVRKTPLLKQAWSPNQKFVIYEEYFGVAQLDDPFYGNRPEIHFTPIDRLHLYANDSGNLVVIAENVLQPSVSVIWAEDSQHFAMEWQNANDLQFHVAIFDTRGRLIFKLDGNYELMGWVDQDKYFVFFQEDTVAGIYRYLVFQKDAKDTLTVDFKSDGIKRYPEILDRWLVFFKEDTLITLDLTDRYYRSYSFPAQYQEDDIWISQSPDQEYDFIVHQNKSNRELGALRLYKHGKDPLYLGNTDLWGMIGWSPEEYFWWAKHGHMLYFWLGYGSDLHIIDPVTLESTLIAKNVSFITHKGDRSAYMYVVEDGYKIGVIDQDTPIEIDITLREINGFPDFGWHGSNLVVQTYTNATTGLNVLYWQSPENYWYHTLANNYARFYESELSPYLLVFEAPILKVIDPVIDKVIMEVALDRIEFAPLLAFDFPGYWLLFHRPNPSQYVVYRLANDTLQLTLLDKHDGIVSASNQVVPDPPAISPDGQYVAFYLDGQLRATSNLRVAALDGSRQYDLGDFPSYFQSRTNEINWTQCTY